MKFISPKPLVDRARERGYAVPAYARVATRPPYPKLGGWNNWWALNWSDDCPVFIVVDLAANKAFPCVNLTPGDGETFTEDDGILDFSDYEADDVGDTVLVIDGEGE